MPTEGDVGDDVGLRQAFVAWEARHTPPVSASAQTTEPRTTRWRSRRLEQGVLIVLVAVLGFVVGDQWLPRAEAQSVVAEPWLPATDSVAAALNDKILRLGQTELEVPLTLDAAEAAILVFGWRSADSVAARVDSVLWVRGRLHSGAHFELRGKLRVAGTGFGALQVRWLALQDSVSSADEFWNVRDVPGVPPADSGRIHFEIPTYAKALWLAEGRAHLLRD